MHQHADLGCLFTIRSNIEGYYLAANGACNTYIDHAEEGALRLAEGSTSEATGAQFGLVEVFADGGWGRLCIPRTVDQRRSDVAAADADASVICRQLGFLEGISTITPVSSLPPP